MKDILPYSTNKEVKIKNPEVLDIRSERANVILDALSSETTRDVFVSIYEKPRTISDVANKTCNSIQNTKYHIQKLEDSNLVEKKNTRYSKKGNEMNIYNVTNEAVVLVASEKDQKQTIQKALKKTTPILFIFTLIIAYLYSTAGFETEKETGQEFNDFGIETRETDIVREYINEVVVGPFSFEPQLMIPIVFLSGVLFGLISFKYYNKI